MTCHMTSHLSTTFREDAPRPPVPGGGEDESSCIKGTSHMTSCERRRDVVMSHIGSVTSTDVLMTTQQSFPSEINKCVSYKSVCGQFQQSNLERGCEPDGCVKVVTKFSENGTEFCIPEGNLKQLLEDSSGVSYFRRFLSTELSSDVLEFWLACTGFRKVEEGKLRAVALAIFKKFVARSSNRLGISDSTKLAIKERLKYGRVEATIFDDAFMEVELLLCKDFYPLFLKSKEYAEYAQTRSANISPIHILSDGSSSPCQCVAKLTALEHNSKSDTVQHCSVLLKKGKSSLDKDSLNRDYTQPPTCRSYRNVDEETLADDSDYCTVGRSVSPTRAPVTSVQGSQSSGALTDDAFSLTDSSLSLDDRDRGYFSKLSCPLCPNCCCHGNARSYGNKQPGQLMRFVMRGGNLSEKNPQQFARLLSEKLSQVVHSQLLQDTQKQQQQQDVFRDGASGVSLPVVSLSSTSTFLKMSSANSVLLVSTTGELEENAQSILERHVSRVFDSPDTQQTPTRSVDSHSLVGLPLTHLDCHSGQDSILNRLTLSGNVSKTMSHLPPQSKHCAEQSDSGGSLSRTVSTATKGQPHDFVNGLLQPGVGHQPGGVLLSRQQQQQPCNHTCAKDKVITWMLVNDQIHSADVHSICPENDDTSASKFSTKLSWSAGNKSDGFVNQRPMPSQLIVQDPMMPLLNPPDPATQLEEARRRLQLESTTRVPPKSMMCDIGLSSDRDAGSAVHPSFFAPQSTRLAGHLLSPDDNLMMLNRVNVKGKSADKQKTSLPATPSQPPVSTLSHSLDGSQSTTVVYFLCDEPIPYSTKVHFQPVTLAQFKELVAKKGSYRYYFKCACNDFNTGYVYEEVMDDESILPLIEGKICAKVVRSI